MRGRLMAYSKGMPAGKLLREKFQRVSTLREVAGIAAEHIAALETATMPATDFAETLA
jgi:hypothetical protein